MRALVALGLCWVVGACGAQQGGSTEAIRRVHGVVVNAVSQAPIARALVTTTDQRMAQLTDSEGRFEFDVKTGGANAGVGASSGPVLFGGPTVFLMARKPGYRPSERATMLSLTNTAALDATVKVPLVPEGIVAGHVVTEKAEPPVGVQVQLMQRRVEEWRGVWRPMQFQQTDARGEYRFADLAAGNYKIVTREWTERGAALPDAGGKTVGYPPVAYPGGTDVATAGLLHVKPGETVTADMSLRAVPYFPVELAVANANGTRVGVQVEDSEGGSGFALGYNARTQRVEGSLPAGNYRLTLSGYGEQPLMAVANLTVGGPVRGGTLTLGPGASVRVEVREEFTAASSTKSGSRQAGLSSQPMETRGQQGRSVEVYLQPVSGEGNGGGSLRNGRPSREVANDALVIENVRPGSYWVRVTPRRGYVASATANGVDVLRRPLTIAGGGGGALLQVTLRDDTGTLTGTVAGAAAANAGNGYGFTPVWSFPMDGQGGGQPVQSFVGPGGQFQSTLAPGRYVVLASDTPMQEVEYRDEVVMNWLAVKGTPVTVTPGGAATVALTVVPLGPEEGR